MIHAWTILGDPVGKGRPRFCRKNGIAYTPARTRNWESVAREVFACKWDGGPTEGPVSIDVVAVFARPKRLMRAKDPDARLPHTSRPDCDNLLKAVLDSMQAAGVMRDDSQVIRATVSKYYATKSEGPRVEVEFACEGPRYGT